MDVESPSTELSKLGAEALRDLYNNLAGVKAFALEQAPDVCQQMIRWEVACGVMATVILCVVFCVIAMAAPKLSMQEKRATGDGVGTWFVATLVGLGTLIVCAGQIAYAVKALVAPKLFLLEKIAAMLKGVA